MIIEFAIRRIIKYLELFLILAVLLIFTTFYFELFYFHFSFILPLELYILSLTLYNYILIILQSSKFLDDIPLDTNYFCTLCNKFCSPMTFHCDMCNRCYYKRDHHCPWIGKCVSADNYKEFYSFIMFFNIFLVMRIVKGNIFFTLDLLGRFIFLCIFCLFIWMNFLICVDQSGGEYDRYGGRFRPKVFYGKWKNVMLENDIRNVKYMLLPFLTKSVQLVGMK